MRRTQREPVGHIFGRDRVRQFGCPRAIGRHHPLRSLGAHRSCRSSRAARTRRPSTAWLISPRIAGLAAVNPGAALSVMTVPTIRSMGSFCVGSVATSGATRVMPPVCWNGSAFRSSAGTPTHVRASASARVARVGVVAHAARRVPNSHNETVRNTEIPFRYGRAWRPRHASLHGARSLRVALLLTSPVRPEVRAVGSGGRSARRFAARPSIGASAGRQSSSESGGCRATTTSAGTTRFSAASTDRPDSSTQSCSAPATIQVWIASSASSGSCPAPVCGSIGILLPRMLPSPLSFSHR
jgi:hypothetical protein